VVAVTKSTTGTWRGLPLRGHKVQTPSSAAVRETMAPAGSDMQTLPPTVAAFQILNDIRNASMHWSNSGTACHSGGPLKSCSSTILQVAAISSPAGVTVNAGQPSCSRSTRVSVETCGSENSQVPPPRNAWPSRHSMSSNDLGRFTSTIVLRFISSLQVSVAHAIHDGGGRLPSEAFSARHPRYGTPWIAIIVSSIIYALLAQKTMCAASDCLCLAAHWRNHSDGAFLVAVAQDAAGFSAAPSASPGAAPDCST